MFLDISGCEFICSHFKYLKTVSYQYVFHYSLAMSPYLCLFNSLESSCGCLLGGSTEMGGTSFLPPFILTRASSRSEFLEAI